MPRHHEADGSQLVGRHHKAVGAVLLGVQAIGTVAAMPTVAFASSKDVAAAAADLDRVATTQRADARRALWSSYAADSSLRENDLETAIDADTLAPLLKEAGITFEGAEPVPIAAATSSSALKARLQQVNGELAQGGMSTKAEAGLRLEASQLHFELAARKEDRRSNAKQGFKQIQRAADLDSSSQKIQVSHGRATLGIWRLNRFMRAAAGSALGINPGQIAKRSISLLARSPNHALAQVVRHELAKATGDDSAEAAAKARIDALDSGAVARARAALEADAKRGG